MTILGIDPGYAIVGFGIIQGDRSRQRVVQYGAIRTAAGQPLAKRLKQIYDDACQLIEQFGPDAIAIEELFFSKNVTTGIPVAHGRGVLLLAGETMGVPMYEYTPMQIKQAVTGYGKAEKRQVMEMVKRLLALEKIPRPDDAADALAVALCHARSNTSLITGVKGDDTCSTT